MSTDFEQQLHNAISLIETDMSLLAETVEELSAFLVPGNNPPEWGMYRERDKSLRF